MQVSSLNFFFFPSKLFTVSSQYAVCHSSHLHTKVCHLSLRLTGEALTQSSLLEADGENADSMVTMTTTVEPMNLHHAMLRSPGRCMHTYNAYTQLTTHLSR